MRVISQVDSKALCYCSFFCKQEIILVICLIDGGNYRRFIDFL
jgi:hypothetical protein